MKRLFILTLALSLLFLSGCNSSGDVDSENLTMPQTSANEQRKSYNEELVRTPAKHESQLTYVTVDIRPKFVLHIDEYGNVIEFESLNTDGDTLSEETSALWQNVAFEDAFSAIIEQCIIDGYISDNNPEIHISVDGKSASSVQRTANSILDELTTTHGLSVDIQMDEE